jgi:hypothetical protein
MTRADESKPVRRVVTSLDGREEYVVEIYSRRIVMRPKGRRSGAVEASWGALFDRMTLSAAGNLAARRVRVKRGMQL